MDSLLANLHRDALLVEAPVASVLARYPGLGSCAVVAQEDVETLKQDIEVAEKLIGDGHGGKAIPLSKTQMMTEDKGDAAEWKGKGAFALHSDQSLIWSN
mmetsp:Transcript_60827/g.162696  ORF Transcript_60827/g.162696 Transcript_60827/m.162696 type:complete len:100 (+) Transcript_60827:113-412(+)